MSYANSGSGRERIVAIGLVGLVQGGIIAALLSGLAIQFVDRIADKPLETYNIKDVPPPPPDVVPPKKIETLTTSMIPETKPLVTDPIVKVDTPPLVSGTPDIVLLPPVTDMKPAPIPSPTITPTPAADLSRGAAARGAVGEWFPRSEYPSAALRAGIEGRVSIRLSIGANGRATGCDVVTGSGSEALDAATCRLALRNGRFEPARDALGNKTATQLRLPPIVWRIEN